jgi:imidazolonepropionase-like amidohydrolase
VTTVRVVDAAHEASAPANVGRADFLFIRDDVAPAAADAILDESRKFNVPVTAGVMTMARAQQLVKSGAACLVGMIGDTEDIDQSFLAKLRALQIVVSPALALHRSDAALRNTKRMAAAGVPIAVGSGGDTHRELELLVEAGLTPLDVTTAATRNGALALRKLDEMGTIEAGKRANFLLLKANPLEDVRNFRNIDQVMRDGEWVK